MSLYSQKKTLRYSFVLVTDTVRQGYTKWVCTLIRYYVDIHKFTSEYRL